MPFLAGQELSVAAIEAIANPPRARVLQSVAQSIPNLTFTAITFTEQDFVKDVTHDVGVDSTRLTITVAGIYLLTGALCFATNGTGVRAVAWRKNGVDIPGGGSNVAAYTPGQPLVVARPTMVSLVVGDYVQMFGSQSSTNPLNTYVSSDYIRADMSIRLIRNDSL